MGKAGNVADLLSLNPLALFGNGSRAVICALSNGTHMLNFGRIDHVDFFLSKNVPNEHRAVNAQNTLFFDISIQISTS
jgi:hypothetical protein